MLTNKFSLQLLITDEVSMVGANLRQCIHERSATVAGVSTVEPFAGVSILTTGDFQQLPPVGDTSEYKTLRNGYVVLANIWLANFQIFELTKTMRQECDTSLAELMLTMIAYTM